MKKIDFIRELFRALGLHPFIYYNWCAIECCYPVFNSKTHIHGYIFVYADRYTTKTRDGYRICLKAASKNVELSEKQVKLIRTFMKNYNIDCEVTVSKLRTNMLGDNPNGITIICKDLPWRLVK